MNDNFLNIQPSPLALVQSLRDIGYSMESAIADVIDNSITAEAENIHVRFAWDDGSPWLAVIIVLLRKLDRYDGLEKKLNSLVEHTRPHLELVFHRFLSPSRGRKSIKIFLNNDPLDAFNPFNPSHPATQELLRQFIHVEGQSVTVQPYVLPHYNKTSRDKYEKYSGRGGYLQNQGFYVYRNRRLIIRGTWFRLIKKEELTKLLRVQVDLPNSLDHLWKIDVKKSNAYPPEAIRSELKLIIDKIAYAGKKVYRQRGKKLANTVKVPGWTRTAAGGKITYKINKEHPLIAQIQSCLQKEQQQAFNVRKSKHQFAGKQE